MASGEEPRPCPDCGYFEPPGPCRRCGGTIRGGDRGPAIRPGRGLPPVDLVQGFCSPFAATLALLTGTQFFGRLFVPVAANLVATTLLAATCYWVAHPAAVWLLDQPWGPLDALLRGPLSWTNETAALVLTAVTALLVGPALLQTITAPFLDPLADLVEKQLGGPGLAPVQRSTWHSLSANVRASAQVVAMQLLVLPLCLLLSFCNLGLLVALLVAAFLNALLWFEIPFARRGYSLEQRIAVVRHNWARALGFGLGFQLAVVVPLLNVLVLAPAAAVATTTLYFRFAKVPARGIVRPPPGEPGEAGPTADDPPHG